VGNNFNYFKGIRKTMKNAKQIGWVKVKCSQCGKMFECKNNSHSPCRLHRENYSHERYCYCRECTKNFAPSGQNYGCEYREAKVRVMLV
jgi:hypothetical protein